MYSACSCHNPQYLEAGLQFRHSTSQCAIQTTTGEPHVMHAVEILHADLIAIRVFHAFRFSVQFDSA